MFIWETEMHKYIEDIVYKVRQDIGKMTEDEIDAYVEKNFNSEFAQVPDFDIDWFHILDYIIEYQMNEYGELRLETPLDKVVVWNIYVYLQVKHCY